MKRIRSLRHDRERTGCPSSSGATARARTRPTRGSRSLPTTRTRNRTRRTLGDDPPDDAVEEHVEFYPAGSAALDDLGDDVGDGAAGGVDHDRVVGRPQRRHRPAAVERVAPRRARPAPSSTATVAVGRALRRAGGAGPARRRSAVEEHLHRRVREHDGADVAAFDDSAAVLARPTPAGGRRAPSRTGGMRGDRRHRGGDLGSADLGAHVAAVERRDAVLDLDRAVARRPSAHASSSSSGDACARAPPA